MTLHSSLTWKQKFLDMITTSLPIEALKDIPNSLSITLVIITYVCIIFGFLYTYILSYETLRDEVYLSLTKSAGSCSKVSKIINGMYLADTHGNWEGSVGFEYRSAIYVMTLRDFNGDDLSYSALLENAFAILDTFGNLSYSLNLADNLIVWMAVTMYANTGNQIHTFQLFGDPKTVFNPSTLYASMSNEAGNCDVPTSITYDKSVGIFTISYPISRYVISNSCMSIANPVHFGYTGLGSDFTIRIDMQSAITALGINTGIITPEQLEKVPYTESYFTSDGIDYIANFYYYPRYPGMTPLFCVTLSTTGQLVCALEYGSIYAYPLFNHLGASFKEPIYCDCANGIGSLPNCSQFYLLTGLLFYDYKGMNMSSSYNNLVTLITSSTSGKELNRNAYNISADSILSYSTIGSEWRHRAYEFCTQNFSQGCSILSIAAGDQSLHTVNPYYYQVPFGSCNNTFTISKEAQAKLLETPPTQLTEMYYECSRSKQDSLVSALGISVGNTVLIRYLLILTISMLLFGYNRSCWFRYGCSCCQSSQVSTYTNKEKEKVLHFFAFNLLLSRDGLYKPPSLPTLPSSSSSPSTAKSPSEPPLDPTLPSSSIPIPNPSPIPLTSPPPLVNRESEVRHDFSQERSVIQSIQQELSLQNNIKRFYVKDVNVNANVNKMKNPGEEGADIEKSLIPHHHYQQQQHSQQDPSTPYIEVVWNPFQSPIPSHTSPPPLSE